MSAAATSWMEIQGLAIETSEHVNSGLPEGDQKREDFTTTGQQIEVTYMHIYAHFWAPENKPRSSLREKSTSMRLAPARSCMIIPEVTIGLIPSSMSVPRLEARMTRIQ
jgi:hypothetical protein